MKQGVLGLLGKGSEVDAVGRFIHDLAAKIPAALVRIRNREVMEALEDLGVLWSPLGTLERQKVYKKGG